MYGIVHIMQMKSHREMPRMVSYTDCWADESHLLLPEYNRLEEEGYSKLVLFKSPGTKVSASWRAEQRLGCSDMLSVIWRESCKSKP